MFAIENYSLQLIRKVAEIFKIATVLEHFRRNHMRNEVRSMVK